MENKLTYCSVVAVLVLVGLTKKCFDHHAILKLFPLRSPSMSLAVFQDSWLSYAGLDIRGPISLSNSSNCLIILCLECTIKVKKFFSLSYGVLELWRKNSKGSDLPLLPMVPQLDKCLNFMAFRGVILYRVQSFLPPVLPPNILEFQRIIQLWHCR